MKLVDPKVAVLMRISTEILERKSLLSTAEDRQLVIAFESPLLSLISLVVVLIKLNNDKKNNRLIFGRITVIF